MVEPIFNTYREKEQLDTIMRACTSILTRNRSTMHGNGHKKSSEKSTYTAMAAAAAVAVAVTAKLKLAVKEMKSNKIKVHKYFKSNK